MRRFSRRATIAAAALVVTIGGGSAFAYWLNSGSATAQGQTASGTKLTVTNLYTSSPAMAPDGVQYWSFQANNDGETNVAVDSAGSSIAITPFSTAAVDGAQPPCTEADYVIETPYVPASIYAHSWNSGSFTLHFINNPAKNQENCKGVKVPVAVTVKAA